MRAEEQRQPRAPGAAACETAVPDQGRNELHGRPVLLGYAHNSFVTSNLVRSFADLVHVHLARAVAVA
jgi:hypothetical protein